MSTLGKAGPSPPRRRGRRRRAIGMETGSRKRPSSSPALPPDLMREVLSRCDHETLVRCAVSSRLLCRCMLDDPAFLRSRASGFAPSLFLGLFHHRRDAGTRFVEAPTLEVIRRAAIGSFLSDNADLLRRFDELVACRGGLVVLRRDTLTSHNTVELCVCHPMTGRCCILPPPAPGVTGRTVAILTGEDAGSSSPFQLLVVDVACGWWRGSWMTHLRTQLFSSPRPFPAIMPGGAWGPIRRAAPPQTGLLSTPGDTPVVINRVAHWLHTSLEPYEHNVVALHVDEGRTELIRGPRDLTQTWKVLLASTADRRLSVVAVEELVISVSVLSEEESQSWERHTVIVREGILAYPTIWLDCFGEKSGMVVICEHYVPWRLVLNLETKEVTHMPAEELPWRCYVFEMDVPSLAAALLKLPSP
ncbi:hypothetical protein ACP70R_020602 [Stipagrostis hirtigluma subsp. patula]